MSKRMIYPIELLLTGVRVLCDSRKTNTALFSPERNLLLYTFQKVSENYLPLGRDYKPLGMQDGPWVDYKDYPFLEIPPKFLNEEFVKERSRNHNYYSFNDGSYPKVKKQKIEYVKILIHLFAEKNEMFMDRLYDMRIDLK